MSDIAQPLAPDLMAWLYDYARMAVQIFLVLGGYLAAASLAPEGVARFDSAGQQVGKRFVRLVVPYVVALLVTVLVSALVRPWFDHPSVPGDPDVAQLITHALLLHSVADHESLSAGVWYVAIDFQLFTLSVLAFAAVRALPQGLPRQRAAWVGQGAVVAGVAASLWGFNRDAQWDVWAVYFFGAYGLGMMAFWASRAPRAAGWVVAMAVLGAVALVLDFRGAHCAGACNGLAVGVGHAHSCGTPVAGRGPAGATGADVVLGVPHPLRGVPAGQRGGQQPVAHFARRQCAGHGGGVCAVIGGWSVALPPGGAAHAVTAHIAALAGQPGGGRGAGTTGQQLGLNAGAYGTGLRRRPMPALSGATRPSFRAGTRFP